MSTVLGHGLASYNYSEYNSWEDGDGDCLLYYEYTLHEIYYDYILDDSNNIVYGTRTYTGRAHRGDFKGQEYGVNVPDFGHEQSGVQYGNSTITSSKNIVSNVTGPITVTAYDANIIYFTDGSGNKYTATKDGGVTKVSPPSSSVPSSGTFNTALRDVNSGDFMVASDIRNLFGVYSFVISEWSSVKKIRSNPDMHLNKQYKLDGELDPAAASWSPRIVKGAYPLVNDFNMLYQGLNYFCDDIMYKKRATNVAVGTTSWAYRMNEVIESLRSMVTLLDSYSYMWGSDNYCVLSCQVSCQWACMLACQGCNNHTCHDQNCGGWS